MAELIIEKARPIIRPYGTCLSFPGSSGSISLGTANPFGSLSFYIGGWVKWAGLNGGFQTLFAKRDSYAANGLMFSAALDNVTGKFNIDTVTSFIPFQYLFPQGKWTWFLWVHDVTSGHEYLYINGLLISTQGPATLGTKTDALISFGACENPSKDWFNGKIDEPIIGVGAPTADEVLALYAKETKPGTPWAYLKLDEGSGSTATDATGNGNNGTIAGATYATDPVRGTRSAVTRYPVAGVSFAGDQSNAPIITVPNNPTFQGLTAFTLEMYLTIDRISSSNYAVICEYEDGSNHGFALYFNQKLLRLAANVKNGTTQQSPNANTILVQGRTYHVALVWNRSNVQFYFGGTKDGVSPALSGGDIGNPNTFMSIGNNLAGNSAPAITIREFRFSNIARYSANFTPPSGILSKDANTIELFHFREGVGTTTTGENGNVGTLSGSTLPTWIKRAAI